METLSAEQLEELKRKQAKSSELLRAHLASSPQGHWESLAAWERAENEFKSLLNIHAPALIAAAERERWIPVAESLPDAGETVSIVVRVADTGHTYWSEGHLMFEKEKWSTSLFGFVPVNETTHWRRVALPERMKDERYAENG